MADPTQEQLGPLEEQFNAHPAIQAFLAQGTPSVMGWMRAVSEAAHDTGIEMPHDYQPAVEGGRVAFKKKSFIQRNGWFLPAVAVGAPIAAGVALAAAPAALAPAAGGSALTPGPLLGGAYTGGATAATATGATVGGGGYGALAGIAKTKGIDMLSKGLTAYAGSKANDRGTTLEAMMDRDRTQIAANQDQRAAERDATKQLAIANYTGSGGYKPSAGGDPRYTSGVAGPQGSSPAQIQAAKDMERILLERINNPFKLTDVEKYSKAGKGERAAGYAGLALNGYSAFKGLL